MALALLVPLLLFAEAFRLPPNLPPFPPGKLLTKPFLTAPLPCHVVNPLAQGGTRHSVLKLCDRA